MTKRKKTVIINTISRKKYFVLLFDSSPNNSRREQISQFVKQVDVQFDNKEVSIRESFLFFWDFVETDVKNTACIKIKILEKWNFIIKPQISILYNSISNSV